MNFLKKRSKKEWAESLSMCHFINLPKWMFATGSLHSDSYYVELF